MHQPKVSKKEEQEKTKFTIHYIDPSARASKPTAPTVAGNNVATPGVYSIPGMINYPVPKGKKPKATAASQAYASYAVKTIVDGWNTDHHIVISMDPATDNFGFRIERRWLTTNEIETIELITVPFDRNVDEYGYCPLYTQISDFLDRYKDWYPHAHLFIVERQITINNRSSRISQHIFSYFLPICRASSKRPILIELDPKVKGKSLGVPKDLNKKQLKQWGVEKTIYYFLIRGDEKGLSLFLSPGKKDDRADTVIQVEGFYALVGLQVTVPKVTITYEKLLQYIRIGVPNATQYFTISPPQPNTYGYSNSFQPIQQYQYGATAQPNTYGYSNSFQPIQQYQYGATAQLQQPNIYLNPAPTSTNNPFFILS